MLGRRQRVFARGSVRATSPHLTSTISGLRPSVPFLGPEAIERARGGVFRSRIGANENPFGPSPMAMEAMRATMRESWMYGDPENDDLRLALAEYHGIEPANVLVGEGIDALLGYSVRLLVEPNAAVVSSAGAYPTVDYHIQGYGGRLIRVPYAEDAVDIGALIAAAEDHDAVMIYLANPDNPMGSWYERPFIDAMIRQLPERCTLLLDEAYSEFAPEGVIPDLDSDDPRVLRFRTFSKAYSLAGLRVGYAIGEASLIAAFDLIRNHFGVNRLAQAAAIAALEDSDHLTEVVEDVTFARERIAEIATRNGLRPLPSATNFVTIDCGADGEFARAVLRELEHRDVFVRMPGVAPLDRCIRITAGLPAELDYLQEMLPKALLAAKERLADRV